VTGDSSFISSGNIILDSTNTFTGTVQVSLPTSSDLTLVDTTALDLDHLTQTTLQVANLNVTALGITQTDNLVVTGTAMFNGGAGVVTLTTATNDFTGAVSANNTGANAIQLTDKSAIILGMVATANNLTVSGVGITQNTSGLTVTGTSAFNGGAGAIVLDNRAANDFIGAVSANNTGANAIQVRDANTIILGTVATANNLTVTAQGAITDGNGVANNITAGTANLSAASIGTNSDSLETTIDTFTAVAVNGGVFIDESDGLALGTITANGTGNHVAITALGSITDDNGLLNNVTAATATLSAASIGTLLDPIETGVSTLTANTPPGKTFVINNSVLLENANDVEIKRRSQNEFRKEDGLFFPKENAVGMDETECLIFLTTEGEPICL
jgi:hypothetical protein